MPQIPQTGTYEQVLRMLGLMAGSEAFTLEMNDFVSQLALGPDELKYNIVDINGGVTTLGLGEQQFAYDEDGNQLGNSWVETAFAHVQLTPALAITGPFPSMLLIGAGSSIAPSPAGQLEEHDFQGNVFLIDCVTLCQQDDPQAGQREALLMCTAFERLVRRNDSLGGLVQLIRPVTPTQPGGGGSVRNLGLIMGARVRLEARTLIVS